MPSPSIYEFAGGEPAFLALATAHHERCLQDPVRYAKLQQGARQTAATFTMERHMPELMAVLERAAAPQPLEPCNR